MKNKITSVILLLTIIIGIAAFSGCNNKREKINDTYIGIFNGSLGTDCIVTYKNEILEFYDFKTGERQVMCARPDCTHQKYSSTLNPDPVCAAALPKETFAVAAIIKDGYLYLFVTPDEINKTDIYKSDLDGENRRKVGEMDCHGFTSDFIVSDDYLFFFGKELFQENRDAGQIIFGFSNKLFIGIMEWDTLKIVYKDPVEKMLSKANFHLFDNVLYYMYREYEPDGSKDIFELRSVNLDNFEKLDPIPVPENSSGEYVNCVFKQDYAYFLDGYDLYRLNLDNRQKELYLPSLDLEGSATLMGITGKYLFIYLFFEDRPIDDNYANIIFDENTKMVHQFDMTYTGIKTNILPSLFNVDPDGEYIFISFQKPGKNLGLRYIKIEDLINKSFDFLDIDYLN